MKIYRFIFPQPLTEEQEQCLYAGFSSFYYDVEDKLGKGLELANNKLYAHASRLMDRVTGVSASKIAMQRIDMLRSSLGSLMEWNRTAPGAYEFKFELEHFEIAIPTSGKKLEHALLHDKFEKQVLPKLGLKKEDVKIEIVTEP
jgi:hypothetical protein